MSLSAKSDKIGRRLFQLASEIERDRNGPSAVHEDWSPEAASRSICISISCLE
jgi:hypothetical protein